MSATVTIDNPGAVDSYPQIARPFMGEPHTVLLGAESIPSHHIERTEPIGSLQFTIPDFDYQLSVPILDLSPRFDLGSVNITVAIDEDVFVRITLIGNLSRDDGQFRIENTGLKIEGRRNRARTDFIASSFWAMLGLAETVRLHVADLQLDLNLKVQLELQAISDMLQRRLLAYRIMTIERATGREFDLPSFITPENVKGVALIYHAIVERSFAWPIGFVDYGWPATKEILERLLDINKLSFVKLGPHPHGEVVFGQVISLGSGFVTVYDKVIEGFDKAIEEFRRNDGHIVRVLIRSLTGRGAYDFPEAPRLSKTPWDAGVRTLSNLESKLDTRLAERYDELAAATLAGLSEEERGEVTTRPDLDEHAFTFEG